MFLHSKSNHEGTTLSKITKKKLISAQFDLFRVLRGSSCFRG